MMNGNILLLFVFNFCVEINIDLPGYIHCPKDIKTKIIEYLTFYT